MRNKLDLIYRPKTFDDVVGQNSTIEILKKQIETRQFKPTYLLCGPSGCGKTTIARILAREINNGKGSPIEIDCASNNNVESMREIMADALKRSLDSEYKVYIFDEVQILSLQAWNTQLKTIEEPPKNTIFIYCTTDPQKVIPTVLSRVQRFDFQKIPTTDIRDRLKYICEQETIPYKDDALLYISRLAEGGMRKAIVMLEKCAGFGEVNIDNVVKAIGTTNYDVLLKLTNSILDYDAKGMIDVIEETFEKGIDLKEFIDNYILFITELAKFDITHDMNYLSVPPNYEQAFNEIITLKCDRKFLASFLKKLIELKSIIKWETHPKETIESHLLWLCVE